MSSHVSIVELNSTVNKTVQAIEDGKKEIFEISENARVSCTTLEEEYINIKSVLKSVIDEVDKLEIRGKMARNMIKTITENFSEFNEKDIRKAYELSNLVQVELSLKREKEREFSARRNEIELRLKDSKEVLKRAELLTTKVSVALEYLTTNMFEQLEDMKQKQEIGLKVIEAQENERHRMSRDIHDGPAQSMANIILKAEYCERLIDRSATDAKKELSELRCDVRDTLKDLRKIIYDLMPMSLEDLGLIPSLSGLINELSNSKKIKVKTDIKEEYEITDRLTKLTIFRIIQETLNNIKKHSKATKINILLHICKDNVKIVIEDNGIGFDVKLAEMTNRKDSGYGLYNIGERVDILGGKLEVKSILKKGTRVNVSIPSKIEEVKYELH